MNMSFNFNKVKRSFFTVELKDPESTEPRRLIVKMPKKKTFEKAKAIESMNMDEMTVDDAYDTLGALVAELLSNNMSGERIFPEYVIDNYDIEEMNAFMDAYMSFVNGKAATDPN